MITLYLALRISVVILTLLCAVKDLLRKENKQYIALSDWVVNEKGQLEDTTEQQPGSHPIKIRH